VEIAASVPSPQAGLVPLNPKATVEMLKTEAERIEIRTDSPYSSPHAYLVLTESLFPGWTAQIDGRASKLYLANQRFMAVRLPKGKHYVVFEYHSTRFKTGLWLSIVGVLAVVACCLFPFGSGNSGRRRL
jgi:uncharacterized membrane protein YfhO